MDARPHPTRRFDLAAAALPETARRLVRAHPEAAAGAGAALLLVVAYFLVFLVTGAANPPGAVRRALINVVPAAILAVPAYLLLRRRIARLAPLAQAPAHLALALAYALAWYLGIQVLYGLENGWMTTGLTPRSFSGIAFTWQMFQGVTLYAVIAGAALAARFRDEARQAREALAEARGALARAAEARGAVSPPALAPAAPPAPPRQLLLRQDREIVPVAVADIVRVSGAGDKAEVVTRTARVLTTTNLTELEAALPDGFLRAHRSHVVALGAVLHAEPAGNGRLTLHLLNGDSVTTSRAGARAFREAAL